MHERAHGGLATLPPVEEMSWARPSARRVATALAATAAVLLGLASGSTAATDAGVQIVYRAYQPAELTVLVGQPVTWRNSGLGPHTVTADAGQFDSSTLQAGDTFSYTFSAPGTYAYSCTIHPTMHGKVVALARAASRIPSRQPVGRGDRAAVQEARRAREHDARARAGGATGGQGAAAAAVAEGLLVEDALRAQLLHRQGDVQPPWQRPPSLARRRAGSGGRSLAGQRGRAPSRPLVAAAPWSAAWAGCARELGSPVRRRDAERATEEQQ